MTGLTVRTIRYYIKEGLIPRPDHRGPATVYTKNHALRLKAIKLLRKRDRLSIPTIKARLTALSDEGVEALLSPPRPTPPVPVVPTSLGLGESWEHIELMPGLKLLVSTPASPVVQRLASEIVAQYRKPVAAQER